MLSHTYLPAWHGNRMRRDVARGEELWQSPRRWAHWLSDILQDGRTSADFPILEPLRHRPGIGWIDDAK